MFLQYKYNGQYLQESLYTLCELQFYRVRFISNTALKTNGWRNNFVKLHSGEGCQVVFYVGFIVLCSKLGYLGRT